MGIPKKPLYAALILLKMGPVAFRDALKLLLFFYDFPNLFQSVLMYYL
jgi:hypothetical protein